LKNKKIKKKFKQIIFIIFNTVKEMTSIYEYVTETWENFKKNFPKKGKDYFNLIYEIIKNTRKACNSRFFSFYTSVGDRSKKSRLKVVKELILSATGSKEKTEDNKKENGKNKKIVEKIDNEEIDKKKEEEQILAILSDLLPYLDNSGYKVSVPFRTMLQSPLQKVVDNVFTCISKAPNRAILNQFLTLFQGSDLKISEIKTMYNDFLVLKNLRGKEGIHRFPAYTTVARVFKQLELGEFRKQTRECLIISKDSMNKAIGKFFLQHSQPSPFQTFKKKGVIENKKNFTLPSMKLLYQQFIYCFANGFEEDEKILSHLSNEEKITIEKYREEQKKAVEKQKNTIEMVEQMVKEAKQLKENEVMLLKKNEKKYKEIVKEVIERNKGDVGSGEENDEEDKTENEEKQDEESKTEENNEEAEQEEEEEEEEDCYLKIKKIISISYFRNVYHKEYKKEFGFSKAQTDKCSVCNIFWKTVSVFPKIRDALKNEPNNPLLQQQFYALKNQIYLGILHREENNYSRKAFAAKWANPDEGEVLIQIDYGERLIAEYQIQIQQDFYKSCEFTLLGICFRYIEEGQIVDRVVFVLSEILRQDAVACICAFNKVLKMAFFQNINAKKMNISSDSGPHFANFAFYGYFSEIVLQTELLEKYKDKPRSEMLTIMQNFIQPIIGVANGIEEVIINKHVAQHGKEKVDREFSKLKVLTNQIKYTETVLENVDILAQHIQELTNKVLVEQKMDSSSNPTVYIVTTLKKEDIDEFSEKTANEKLKELHKQIKEEEEKEEKEMEKLEKEKEKLEQKQTKKINKVNKNNSNDGNKRIQPIRGTRKNVI